GASSWPGERSTPLKSNSAFFNAILLVGVKHTKRRERIFLRLRLAEKSGTLTLSKGRVVILSVRVR
ncbi:MAG TPA: hypothetical protein VN917_02705, partial [Xanthobacteraceae bacterium]|nr:hypothetical protein [Xanthobacteraceae bacterium]